MYVCVHVLRFRRFSPLRSFLPRNNDSRRDVKIHGAPKPIKIAIENTYSPVFNNLSACFFYAREFCSVYPTTKNEINRFPVQLFFNGPSDFLPSSRVCRLSKNLINEMSSHSISIYSCCRFPVRVWIYLSTSSR